MPRATQRAKRQRGGFTEVSPPARCPRPSLDTPPSTTSTEIRPAMRRHWYRCRQNDGGESDSDPPIRASAAERKCDQSHERDRSPTIVVRDLVHFWHQVVQNCEQRGFDAA